MTTKQVSLSVAQFLDSDRAAALSGVERDDVKRIAEEFVELCYSALGKEPRFLDAEDVRTLVAERLPGRFGRKDPLAKRVPEVLEALLAHFAATTVMSQAFEAQRALPAACEEFVAVVTSGRNAPEAPAKSDPFVHGASKVGRNDPCSCGSGKKFKKCHGKDA